LDHRAATYSQLGDFELALRDARQIIQKNSQDERVYVYCFGEEKIQLTAT
jgi:hypothetical protein